MKPVKLLTTAGLKAGTKVEATNEGRTITAEEGPFADELGPLAQHVYRFKR
jgi:hypothetical protein